MTAVTNLQENIFLSSVPGSLLHRNHLCSQKWLIFQDFYYELSGVYLFIYCFSELHTSEWEREELSRRCHPTSLHPPATQNPGNDRHLPGQLLQACSHSPWGGELSPPKKKRAGRALLPPQPPSFPLLQLPTKSRPGTARTASHLFVWASPHESTELRNCFCFSLLPLKKTT